VLLDRFRLDLVSSLLPADAGAALFLWFMFVAFVSLLRNDDDDDGDEPLSRFLVLLLVLDLVVRMVVFILDLPLHIHILTIERYSS